MRIVGYLSLAIVMASAVLLARQNIAVAATCSTSGTVGSVFMTASVPVSGEYIIWARIYQSASTNNAMMIEVDGQTCFNVGDASLPSGSWVWVSYQGSNKSSTMKYTFNSTGNKSIKYFAKKYDVRIDKVLLLGVNEQCSSNGATPFGDGSNCASGPTVVVDSGEEDNAEVTPSIVTDNPDKVDKVEYYLNGELVQTGEGAAGFDTSNLDNGEYALTTKVKYKDGTTGETTQSIKVTNDTGVLANTKRWVRKNQQPIILTTGGISASGLLGGGYFFYRYWRHKKLYLMHHGF